MSVEKTGQSLIFRFHLNRTWSKTNQPRSNLETDQNLQKNLTKNIWKYIEFFPNWTVISIDILGLYHNGLLNQVPLLIHLGGRWCGNFSICQLTQYLLWKKLTHKESKVIPCAAELAEQTFATLCCSAVNLIYLGMIHKFGIAILSSFRMWNQLSPVPKNVSAKMLWSAVVENKIPPIIY